MHHAGPRDARAAVDAARRRRRALLLRLLQPRLRARRRHRQGELVPSSPSSTTSSSPRRPTRPTTAASRSATASVYVGTVDGRLIALDMKTGKQVWDTKLSTRRSSRSASPARRWSSRTRSSSAPGRRMAVARPDLRRRRQDRREEVGVLHRRRHRGGARRPGAATPGAPAAAAAGCPAPTTPRPTPSGGAPATRRRSTTGPARTGRRGAAAGRQPLHQLGHRARSRHRQAQILPPGAAARRLGLRQLGRRVPDDRARRPQARGASEQGRLRLRLRPHQRQGRECLAAGEEHQLRQGHRSEDRRADRPARPRRAARQVHPLPGDRRRHQLELRLLQPEDRPLLQDRPGMVHGPRGEEDHADHRADGAAQHRRQLHAGRSPGRQGAWPCRRARSRSPARRSGRCTSPSRRWRACSRPAATWSSCPTRAACCTPTTRETGKELWSHNNGVGHNGGIISYSAGGKQYVAVPPAGAAGGRRVRALFGEPYTSMPKDAGALVVFALQQSGVSARAGFAALRSNHGADSERNLSSPALRWLVLSELAAAQPGSRKFNVDGDHVRHLVRLVPPERRPHRGPRAEARRHDK